MRLDSQTSVTKKMALRGFLAVLGLLVLMAIVKFSQRKSVGNRASRSSSHERFGRNPRGGVPNFGGGSLPPGLPPVNSLRRLASVIANVADRELQKL